MQKQIETKLESGLQITYLDVSNESHMHSVPENSETHFKLTIVSDDFAGLTLIKRHQLIYSLLALELKTGVHAMAMHTYTQEEWDKINSSPDSPQCRGGSN